MARLPIILALLIALPAPLAAQVIDLGKIDRRVGTLESEMRAVQRKVFPGGDTRYFEPEVAPQAPPPAPEATPASSPITDLTARVDALEGQLRSMTGQIEALEYKLRQIDDGQKRLRGDVEFRLNALEAPTAKAGDPASDVAPATPTGAAASPPALAPAKPVAAKAASPDAGWAQAFATVAAKDWPAVEAAMTRFASDWPKSPRVAQARYWLGRSFAARNQHPQAAKAFLDVYQSAPRSTPAPDALIGLAGSLNAMAKPKDACQVLGELDAVYGAKLSETQKADSARQRTRAKCAA